MWLTDDQSAQSTVISDQFLHFSSRRFGLESLFNLKFVSFIIDLNLTRAIDKIIDHRISV